MCTSQVAQAALLLPAPVAAEPLQHPLVDVAAMGRWLLSGACTAMLPLPGEVALRPDAEAADAAAARVDGKVDASEDVQSALASVHRLWRHMLTCYAGGAGGCASGLSAQHAHPLVSLAGCSSCRACGALPTLPACALMQRSHAVRVACLSGREEDIAAQADLRSGKCDAGDAHLLTSFHVVHLHCLYTLNLGAGSDRSD